MSAFSFAIDVPVRGEWKNVSLLVTSVQNCFAAMFSELDGANALAMIAGELMENAIKYGHWGPQPGFLRLSVHGSSGMARVSVRNPVSAENLQKLEETLVWIKGFPTPAEAFTARIQEVVGAPRGDSRLGLVRILYEAESTLSFRAIDGDVEVIAEVTIP
jgi:hypothetical protein